MKNPNTTKRQTVASHSELSLRTLCHSKQDLGLTGTEFVSSPSVVTLDERPTVWNPARLFASFFISSFSFVDKDYKALTHEQWLKRAVQNAQDHHSIAQIMVHWAYESKTYSDGVVRFIISGYVVCVRDTLCQCFGSVSGLLATHTRKQHVLRSLASAFLVDITILFPRFTLIVLVPNLYPQSLSTRRIL